MGTSIPMTPGNTDFRASLEAPGEARGCIFRRREPGPLDLLVERLGAALGALQAVFPKGLAPRGPNQALRVSRQIVQIIGQ